MKVHALYLAFLLVIVSGFSLLEKSPEAVKQVARAPAYKKKSNVHCEKKTGSLTSPQKPVFQLPRDFSPKDLLTIVPQKELFDPKIVWSRAYLDFSQYRETQLISETAATITYKLSGPNGHVILRTTGKEKGDVYHEEWEDKEGTVSRTYFEDGTYDRVTDAKGNVYEYGNANDGRKTLSFRDSELNLVKVIDYDENGRVKGVYIYKDERKI